MEFVAPTGWIQSSQSGQQYQIITSSTRYLMDLFSRVSADQRNESWVSKCANLCADYSKFPSLSYCTQIQSMSKVGTTAHILVFVLHSWFCSSSAFWEVRVRQEWKHNCGERAQARAHFCGMWRSVLCVLAALQDTAKHKYCMIFLLFIYHLFPVSPSLPTGWMFLPHINPAGSGDAELHAAVESTELPWFEVEMSCTICHCWKIYVA